MSVSLPKTHLAIFDIDGTLTDSVEVFQTSYLAALQPFGFTDIDTNWGDYEHHTDSWIFQKIYETNRGRLPDHNEKQRFSDELLRIYRDATQQTPIAEIAGARRFLSFLESETPWGIAFATGSLEPPALIKLAACEIRYGKGTLATSSDFLTRNDIVGAAIEGARTYYDRPDFKAVISFGDGLWDLKTAQEMGLHFIGVGEGAKADHLVKLGHTVFRDFQRPEAITSLMQKLA